MKTGRGCESVASMRRRAKSKRQKRKEYRIVGTASFRFDLNVMARSPNEARHISEDLLDSMRLPKIANVKLGKRYRRLLDCIDYWLDCNGRPDLSDIMVELADDGEKTLT
jgi:hypothetical protein